MAGGLRLALLALCVGAAASAAAGTGGANFDEAQENRAPTLLSKSIISSDDYPAVALRKKLQGAVSYRLDVDPRGLVTNCTITQSSGHEVLDAATCRLMGRRARFRPAATPTGYPLSGWHLASVGWWLEGADRSSAPNPPSGAGAVGNPEIEARVAKEVASPPGADEIRRRWGILSDLPGSAWYSTQDLSGAVTYYSWKIPGLVMRVDTQRFVDGAAQPPGESIWWYDLSTGKVSQTANRPQISPSADGSMEGSDSQWVLSVSRQADDLVWRTRSVSGETSSEQVLKKVPGANFASAVATFERVIAQPARAEAQRRAAAQANAAPKPD